MNTRREIKASNEFMQVMAGMKSVDECKALGKEPKKKVQHEAKEQELLFRWAELQKCKYPALRLLHAIPNGGSRHKIEAFNLKKQGLKSGVPDICLPSPNGKYNGLYIELKYGKNKASEEQLWWLDALRDEGYHAKICYGWEDAKNTILEYLGGKS